MIKDRPSRERVDGSVPRLVERILLATLEGKWIGKKGWVSHQCGLLGEHEEKSPCFRMVWGVLQERNCEGFGVAARG